MTQRVLSCSHRLASLCVCILVNESTTHLTIKFIWNALTYLAKERSLSPVILHRHARWLQRAIVAPCCRWQTRTTLDVLLCNPRRTLPPPPALNCWNSRSACVRVSLAARSELSKHHCALSAGAVVVGHNGLFMASTTLHVWEVFNFLIIRLSEAARTRV